jgi:squalene-associated FAD-dependent desaturase
MATAQPLSVAVVGAGWAGLAAAVEATSMGHRVSLFEMAHHPGGRARSTPHEGLGLDNGQHILIGAYRDTLALMRRVGVDPNAVLHRQPLALVAPDGSGLRLPTGHAALAFVRGVLAWRGVPLADRLQLLALAARWRWQGFRCDPAWTVADLAQGCPETIFKQLLDPLCVAALNTPADRASAQVLLTVLRDALFSAPGAADLLLPRAPLNALLPQPALAWLQRHGARWHPGRRVHQLLRNATRWQLDGEDFDHVVLASSASEASRLLASIAPGWASVAAKFRYEPIVTVWLRSPGLRWPQPMTAFPTHGATPAPAQFGFDLGQLGGEADLFALVISGAKSWTDLGQEAIAKAVLQQWATAFGPQVPAEILTLRAEKRATFACLPNLQRPTARPVPGLTVAGDHVQGPYPATLEGAVRSGLAAVRDIGRSAN